jgi:hypothetical protein
MNPVRTILNGASCGLEPENTPADVQAHDVERLRPWGVDGIISDCPHRVRNIMRQHAMPLPKGPKD